MRPLAAGTAAACSRVSYRNEKTGIPLEFLQVLDACVEIPQCGLIRSLNVHVTGAICVWEYHKQWSQLSAAHK